MSLHHRFAATAFLVAITVLAGCSGADDSDQAHIDDQGSSTEPSPETNTPDSDAVDALDLTGPAQAEDVPDMEPVVTDTEPDLPATITDAQGQEITITSAERVLTLDLYGTLTDTIIGLGLQDRLVGRANSDTQDDLAELPVVTQDGHDLNVEAVLDLDPDLILTNTTIGSANSYDQLEAAGVTVARFDEVPSLEEIGSSIDQVGQTFGMASEAEELAAHTADNLDAALAGIDSLASATPDKPRGTVLYMRGTAGVFFVLGADYGAADMLDALQLEDVAAANEITDLKPANAESLVTLDPQIVLAMSEGVESTGGIEGLLDRPGMSATTAGENERIITAADSQLLSYGPRTPDNLLALAEAIYTDQETK